MSERLSAGTQELSLRDAYDKLCACGRTLTWTMSGDDYSDIRATSDCECGMSYIAMFPTIKIEGIDHNLN